MRTEAIRAAVDAAEHDVASIIPFANILHNRLLFGDDLSRADQNDFATLAAHLVELAERAFAHHSAIHGALCDLEKIH